MAALDSTPSLLSLCGDTSSTLYHGNTALYYHCIHFHLSGWPWHLTYRNIDKAASYTFLNLHFSCINHFSFEALFYSCSDLFLLAAYSAQWTSIPKRVGALNNCSLFFVFLRSGLFFIRRIYWLWIILSSKQDLIDSFISWALLCQAQNPQICQFLHGFVDFFIDLVRISMVYFPIINYNNIFYSLDKVILLKTY